MGPGMALNLRRSGLWGALALAGVLSGCGNVLAISGLAGGAGNQGIDLNSVSRQKIEAFGTPILRATLPARAMDLLMSPRNAKGDVTTWEAAEGITLAFRNGILIETRGLGPDLMSAAVPSPSQILGGGSYSRTYFFVAEDDQNQRRDYVCSAETVGAETIVIHGKQHRTRHLRETCTRDVGRITNEFWFEGNVLRKSRQWVAPDVGHVETSRVVD